MYAFLHALCPFMKGAGRPQHLQHTRQLKLPPQANCGLDRFSSSQGHQVLLDVPNVFTIVYGRADTWGLQLGPCAIRRATSFSPGTAAWLQQTKSRVNSNNTCDCTGYPDTETLLSTRKCVLIRTFSVHQENTTQLYSTPSVLRTDLHHSGVMLCCSSIWL